jgi:uncharacterized damage-inducible protein DinB
MCSMTIEELTQEFEQEAATTRRVLARVPSDKLAWGPHEKSMTIGRLAMHIAIAPAHISSWPLEDTFTFKGDPTPVPASTDEILSVHDKGVQTVKANLKKVGNEGLGRNWTAMAGGRSLMTMPKGAMLRSILMNHIYHHRGQLTVYLRLLNIPVPPVYGPSADENPFG